MDEKKGIKEKIGKRNKLAAEVAVILLIYGFAAILGGLFLTMPYNNIKDIDHMTDQGISVRDMDNSTYTVTGEWLDDRIMEMFFFVALGSGMAILGLGIGVMLPKKEDTHRLECDGTGDKTHCPECGLKLSRLEKK